MIYDDLDTIWQQHFPTYTFKNRDVALEEYKTAAKNLESEERVFLNATNIAIISATGLGSLAVVSLDNLGNNGDVYDLMLFLSGKPSGSGLYSRQFLGIKKRHGDAS